MLRTPSVSFQDFMKKDLKMCERNKTISRLKIKSQTQWIPLLSLVQQAHYCFWVKLGLDFF